jgi:hypothetical protein
MWPDLCPGCESKWGQSKEEEEEEEGEEEGLTFGDEREANLDVVLVHLVAEQQDLLAAWRSML